MVRHRVRIRFRKEGDLRLIGHHDLARAWERTFRRAGVVLRVSEGFRPKPRMVFACPLAMGVVGVDEPLDAELAEPLSADDIRARLSGRLPVGLSINSVEVLPDDAPKPRAVRVTFESVVPAERHADVAERIAQATSLPTAGERLMTFLDEIELADGRLRFVSRVTSEGTTRPRDLLAWLCLDDLDERGLFLTRTKVELA